MIYFELETPNRATREDTMLLYMLGEELMIRSQFVSDVTRINADIIRVEVTGLNDANRALAHITNQLRISKNHMAHICAITII